MQEEGDLGWILGSSGLFFFGTSVLSSRTMKKGSPKFFVRPDKKRGLFFLFFFGPCFFGWGIRFVRDYLSGFLTLVFDVGFGVWRLMGDGVWVF